MDDISSLKHIYFFIDEPPTTTSDTPSSGGSMGSVEIADAKRDESLTQIIEYTLHISKELLAIIKNQKQRQSSLSYCLDLWVDARFPGLKKLVETETVAFFKQLKQDVAFAWSDKAQRRDAANKKEREDDWGTLYVVTFCYLLYGIIVTLWRFDGSFEGFICVLQVLARLFVVGTQDTMWNVVRETLRLNRDQKASFWAVRIFADGYWVWWMLATVTEILRDGIASMQW